MKKKINYINRQPQGLLHENIHVHVQTCRSNPQRACTTRVTVVALCVLCACIYMCPTVYYHSSGYMVISTVKLVSIALGFS